MPVFQPNPPTVVQVALPTPVQAPQQQPQPEPQPQPEQPKQQFPETTSLILPWSK